MQRKRPTASVHLVFSPLDDCDNSLWMNHSR